MGAFDSNSIRGKIHILVKTNCVRCVPFSWAANEVRLHIAIGYVIPGANLLSVLSPIRAARDKRLDEARERGRKKRQQKVEA